jgi:hypothetical protein
VLSVCSSFAVTCMCFDACAAPVQQCNPIAHTID